MPHRSLLQYIDSGSIDLRQLDTSNDSTTHYQSSAATHKGLVRPTNEDAYIELADARLWAVADGMGGYKRGDYASKVVINALQSFFREKTLVSTLENLQSRLIEANQACQKAFRAQRVGTTIALLFEFGGYCFFLWAGDSRIYRLRDGHVEQMTHDHSLAQEKLCRGELSQMEAETHPSAHILTRAIGIHRNLKLELRCSLAIPGDRYLLCSDGLYSTIDAEKLRFHLSQGPRSEALPALMSSAMDGGGHDNITAIIVDAEKSL